MSWAKADDRYDDTPKIKRAWRLSGYAVGLHWMAVTSCARHESDGLIDPEWLAERLGVIPRGAAEKAISTLVSLGLFEELRAGEHKTVRDRAGHLVTLGPLSEDAYVVHDYLDFQDSALTLEAKRADERLRKAISARAKELGMSVQDYRKTAGFRADFPPDSERKTSGIQAASGDPDPTRPDPTRPDQSKPPLAPPASAGGEPGHSRSAPPRKGLRANHQNPRAVAAQQSALEATDRSTVAVLALTGLDSDDREQWERLHSSLMAAVDGSGGMAVYVADMHPAGVDGSVLVLDAPPGSWEALRSRCGKLLPACCANVGVEARLATDDEHAGFQRVAA